MALSMALAMAMALSMALAMALAVPRSVRLPSFHCKCRRFIAHQIHCESSGAPGQLDHRTAGGNRTSLQTDATRRDAQYRISVSHFNEDECRMAARPSLMLWHLLTVVVLCASHLHPATDQNHLKRHQPQQQQQQQQQQLESLQEEQRRVPHTQSTAAAGDPPTGVLEQQDGSDAVLTRGQAVIAAVPQEAREAFLMYHLALALNVTRQQQQQQQQQQDDGEGEEQQPEETPEELRRRTGKNARFFGDSMPLLPQQLAAVPLLPPLPPLPPLAPLPPLLPLLPFVPFEIMPFETIPVYEEFGSDLLQWVSQTFALTNADLFQLLRSRSRSPSTSRSSGSLLCTANGVCYSPGDIGCLCCPF